MQIKAAQEAGDDTDFGPILDEFAARVDQHPQTYRWSYRRDMGGCRLIVVDSRASRDLADDQRSILHPGDMAWLDKQMHGGFDHLLVGTSLPFLLSTGLHEFEAWNEAVAAGAWGERFRGAGERLRRAIDLEHWAAFQCGFREVAAMAMEVAKGDRGEAPSTVTFLSGDVHNSYVAEVQTSGRCRIIQAVCSPIRNPLPWSMRRISAFSSANVGGGFGRWLARRASVPDPPFRWHTIHGPWFDNNVATLETDARKLWIRWERGTIDTDGRGLLAGVRRRTSDRHADEDPKLELVQELRIDA